MLKESNMRTFLDYYKEEKQLKLNEGLITSYPIDKLKTHLGNTLRNKILNMSIIRGKLLVQPKNPEVAEEVKRIGDVYGYHTGTKKDYVIQLEPKYPTEILARELPKIVYHVTEERFLPSIRKIGLRPGSSESKMYVHSERIYLLVLINEKDLNHDIKALIEAFNYTEPAVLKVQLTEPFYYVDPNVMPGIFSDNCFGIFTLRNIRPELIQEF